MANGDQSAQDAERDTNNWIESEIKKCTLGGLAHALHAAQDKYSRSHAYMPWYGGMPDIGHIWYDVFGSFPLTNARSASCELMRRFKSLCPCMCKEEL